MHGWYTAARIAGTKGLEGKLRLVQASAFLHFAAIGTEVAFVPPAEDILRFSKVEMIEETGEGSCLVGFDGIASADVAQQLTGKQVLLVGEAPEATDLEEGLQWLVGFALEDAFAGEVGIIEDVDDSPDRFQPLMRVARMGERGPALIPFVDDLIVAIDEEQGRIVMDLPAGILDL